MRRNALGLLLLALAAPGNAGQTPVRCGPQALAAALDSAPRLPEGRSSVAFSAEAWGEWRAWVVRAHEMRPGNATLEILRLRRRSDCNVYDVEARWQAPLPAADYRALVRAAERVGVPRADAFSHEDPARDGEGLALDGTEIELRLKRSGWEARRELNHYGKGGAAVSAIFQALVAKHVPADERPNEGWGTRATGSSP